MTGFYCSLCKTTIRFHRIISLRSSNKFDSLSKTPNLTEPKEDV